MSQKKSKACVYHSYNEYLDKVMPEDEKDIFDNRNLEAGTLGRKIAQHSLESIKQLLHSKK